MKKLIQEHNVTGKFHTRIRGIPFLFIYKSILENNRNTGHLISRNIQIGPVSVGITYGKRGEYEGLERCPGCGALHCIQYY